MEPAEGWSEGPGLGPGRGEGLPFWEAGSVLLGRCRSSEVSATAAPHWGVGATAGRALQKR